MNVLVVSLIWYDELCTENEKKTRGEAWTKNHKLQRTKPVLNGTGNVKHQKSKNRRL